MTQAARAEVDEVLYVPAALALHQRPGVPGIRSTFGTGTELLNSLRLMFSRLSSHCCPNGHYVKPSLAVAAGKKLVCPECGAIFTGTGNAEFSCCGRKLEPLKAQKSDSEHTLNIERADGGIYLTFDHGMTKEHHIAFIAYVNCDRVLLVRLYPEQSPEVLLPALYGGRYYFYCTKHGLFVK